MTGDWCGVSDAELLRLSGEDGEAFGLLYDRHVESIFAWCRARTGEAAADMTAEVFARAWLTRQRFRDEANGSAGPWLFGIANNLYRDWLRRRRVETSARQTGLNYVASDDALYRAAFQFRVGELDLDPAAFIRTALSSGRAKLDGRTTIRGRNVIRIQLSARFDGCLVSIALYYVDPKTYRPVRLVFPPPHGRVAILPAASWSKNLGKRFPRGTLVVLADPSTWSRLGFPMHPSMFLLGFPGYTVPTLFIPGATVSGPRPHLVFDFEEYRLLAPTADNRKLTSVRAMHPRAEKP
jgi:DNA-directed RNA polymerase specialized sigma24 family protein